MFIIITKAIIYFLWAKKRVVKNNTYKSVSASTQKCFLSPINWVSAPVAGVVRLWLFLKTRYERKNRNNASVYRNTFFFFLNIYAGTGLEITFIRVFIYTSHHGNNCEIKKKTGGQNERRWLNNDGWWKGDVGNEKWGRTVIWLSVISVNWPDTRVVSITLL